MQEKSKALRNTVIVSIVVIIVALGIWYTIPREPEFCFNFLHDMAYGDRSIEHPINPGFVGGHNITYYLPEVPALQTALLKEGFYIDPYELTGGKVYYAAFFGPTTKAALLGFQKKYNLEENAMVDDETSDKLKELYGCETNPTATSTLSYTATSTNTK